MKKQRRTAMDKRFLEAVPSEWTPRTEVVETMLDRGIIGSQARCVDRLHRLAHMRLVECRPAGQDFEVRRGT